MQCVKEGKIRFRREIKKMEGGRWKDKGRIKDSVGKTKRTDGRAKE